MGDNVKVSHHFRLSEKSCVKISRASNETVSSSGSRSKEKVEMRSKTINAN